MLLLNGCDYFTWMFGQTSTGNIPEMLFDAPKMDNRPALNTICYQGWSKYKGEELRGDPRGIVRSTDAVEHSIRGGRPYMGSFARA